MSFLLASQVKDNLASLDISFFVKAFPLKYIIDIMPEFSGT